MSILDNGWRQGSIVKSEDFQRFFADVGIVEIGQGDRIVIINQDCDVVCRDYEKEPYVEFLIMRKIERVDGNFTHGKNPRTLDLYVANDGTPEFYRCSIHDRFRCNRQVLEALLPDGQMIMARDQLRVLRSWVAARYIRDAFPDEFNRRISGVGRGIASALKANGSHLTDVLLALDPWDEVDAKSVYRVNLVCLMADEDFADRDKLDRARDAVDMLSAEIDGVDGICLEGCELLPESAITIADYRMLKIWDYDYLSHRNPVGSQHSALRQG